MSSIISVQLDEVGALAADLAELGAQLDDRAHRCRAAATTLAEALGGAEGWAAGGVATAWAGLAALIADRTGGAADALRAAVAAYRVADGAMADDLCPSDPRFSPPTP